MRTDCVVGVFLGLAACNNGDQMPGDLTPPYAEIDVTGTLYSGVVKHGGMILAGTVGPDGENLGGAGYYAQTRQYAVENNVSMYAGRMKGPSLVRLYGSRYHPITGLLGPVTLDAYVDPGTDSATQVHVNAFTHIAAGRTKKLFIDGMPLKQAIVQADGELAVALQWPAELTTVRGRSMEPYGSDGPVNRYVVALDLLAVSGEPGTDIETLRADLADDGAFTAATRTALDAGEQRIDARAANWMFGYQLSTVERLPPRLPDVRHALDTDGDGTVDAMDPCPRSMLSPAAADAAGVICDLPFETRQMRGSTVVADFDGDGFVDAHDEFYSDTHRGTAQGVFDTVPDALGFTSPPRSVGFVDYDGDSLRDIYNISTQPVGLEVRKAATIGQFGVATLIWDYIGAGFNCGVDPPRIWVVGYDWDNNGYADFIGDSGEGCVAMLQSDGTTSSGTPTLLLNDATQSWSGAMADFNGDQIPDIVLVTTNASNARELTVLLADGAGGFTTVTSATTFAVPAVVPLSQPLVGDFDDDGVLDVIVQHEATGLTEEWTRFHGLGGGSFSQVDTLELYGGVGPFALDADGDGDTDVIDDNGLHRASSAGLAAPIALPFPRQWEAKPIVLGVGAAPGGRDGFMYGWTFLDPNIDGSTTPVRAGIGFSWIP